MTKVSIHQPEMFPYFGFFKKIVDSDIFVILDSVSFKKNNFQNRNTFTLINGDKTWLTFPVLKMCSNKLIKDTRINTESWVKMKRTIEQNLKKSPHFDDLLELIEFIDENIDSNLSVFNTRVIKYVLRKVNCSTKVYLQSELEVSGVKSDLLLDICLYFNATHYLSGSGGKSYLNELIFMQNDITIEYMTRDSNLLPHFSLDIPLEYPSIIDVIGNIGWLGFMEYLYGSTKATTAH